MTARSARRLAFFGVAFLFAAPGLRAQCSLPGATQVTWPGVGPLWDFCFRPPSGSSGANGSGLELSDVKYNGTLVLSRAHIPILNVKYVPNPGPTPGACGGANLCYRDWFFSEQAFQCAPVVSPGICTGTTTPAATVCDSCSRPPDGCEDIGSFIGVAVESLPDRLRLTAQCRAGWYRYIPVWEFFADGTIQARFVATSIDYTCVAYTHNHHAYFRLDLDVNGSAGNFVDLVAGDGSSARVSAERNFIDTSPVRSKWRVGKAGSPYVVEVARNTDDGAAGDASVVPNDFPVADGWLLAYDPNEVEDGAALGSENCPAGLNSFVNGQNVDGADIVLWARAAALHQGEAGGEAQDCSMVGPTIRVLSSSPPPGTATAYHTLTPCRVVDTRGPPGAFGGPALQPNGIRSFVLAGQCGISPAARSVAANLTVSQPTAGGHLTVFPAGGAAPPASALNFSAGQTRANNAILPLGIGGAAAVQSTSSGTVHFILDVTGWFE